VELESVETSWGAPPPNLFLSYDEVHVWQVTLGQSLAREGRLAQLLSTDERVRSERYRFPGDRMRFIAARGALRVILARYLAMGAEQIRFSYDEWGKPRLASGLNAMDIRFNTTHSEQVAMYAIARGREVGVDLEFFDRPIEVLDIARSAYAGEEYSALIKTPCAQRRAAFFRIWTCKEAYLKATGLGLACPMDAFAAACADGEPPHLLWVRDHPGETERWSLVTLAPQPGYTAALAVEGHDWRLRCWRMSIG